MALSRGCMSGLVLRDLWLSSGRRCLAVSATSHVLRKTRWMPTAPSKVYKVPTRPDVPEEEKEEIKLLYNTYRTAMKSLDAYLQEDWQRRQGNRAQPGHVLSPEEEEAEHRQLMQLNAAENARMAAAREARLTEQADAIRGKVARLQQAALEQQQRDHQTAVSLVRTQEEISRLYIPRDKLEEAIENAISSETDHNYAIDREGRRNEGRVDRPS